MYNCLYVCVFVRISTHNARVYRTLTNYPHVTMYRIVENKEL